LELASMETPPPCHPAAVLKKPNSYGGTSFSHITSGKIAAENQPASANGGASYADRARECLGS
jgi:hypothetical protein